MTSTSVRFSLPKGYKFTRVPIYGTSYLFLTTRDDYEQCADYLTLQNRHMGSYTDECVGCVSKFQRDGSVCYLIGVFDGSYGTLVHESCHLALNVLSRAGVPVDDQVSEPMCYLIDHLFSECQPILDAANLVRLKEAQAREAAGRKRDKRLEEKKLRAEQDRLDKVFEDKQAAVKAPKPSNDKGARRDRR